MFGMGWSEMILIGIVALIVIGPKDFPKLFRSMGQFAGKARGMAREFSRAMEAAADESGVKDIQKTIRAAANPTGFGADKLREAAGLKVKPGGATEALSKERAETKAKIDAAMAKAATDRKAREAAEAAARDGAEPAPAATAAPADPAPAAPPAKTSDPA